MRWWLGLPVVLAACASSAPAPAHPVGEPVAAPAPAPAPPAPAPIGPNDNVVCKYDQVEVDIDRKTWTATAYRAGNPLGVSQCSGTRIAGFNMRCDNTPNFKLFIDTGVGSTFKAQFTDATMQTYDLACGAAPPPAPSPPIGQPLSALRVFRSRAELGKLEHIVPGTFPFASQSLVWVGDTSGTPTCCSASRLQSGSTEVRIVDVEEPEHHDECSGPQETPPKCRYRKAVPQVEVPGPSMLVRIPRDFTGRIYVNSVPSSREPAPRQ